MLGEGGAIDYAGMEGAWSSILEGLQGVTRPLSRGWGPRSHGQRVGEARGGLGGVCARVLLREVGGHLRGVQREVWTATTRCSELESR